MKLSSFCLLTGAGLALTALGGAPASAQAALTAGSLRLSLRDDATWNALSAGGQTINVARRPLLYA
ncbi:MAG: hypothetical protein C4321_07295, partial [Chloroflexota bacterium]